MKLIIDIPEQRIEQYKNDTAHTFAERAIILGIPFEEIVEEIKRERAYRENRHEIEEMCEVDVILRIIEPYMRGKDNE